ncbi:hypothetical protein [Geobacter pickeringii]|uniref:hypothetical protein n=1 Tax=Geobacter pickeringii TaxID=345632 RepID=UPI0011850216|nr:hypothetical protein [Geobacter pickeringii]
MMNAFVGIFVAVGIFILVVAIIAIATHKKYHYQKHPKFSGDDNEKTTSEFTADYMTDPSFSSLEGNLFHKQNH